MLHGITPLADYHPIYENLSLRLFFEIFIFYSISQNNSFVLWMLILEIKWKKWIYCFVQNKDGNFPLIRECKRNICSLSEVDRTMRFVYTYLRTTDCLLKSRYGHFIWHLKRERDLGQIYIPNRIAIQRIENRKVLLNDVLTKNSPVIRVFSCDWSSIWFSLFSVMLCLFCQQKHSFIHAFHKSIYMYSFFCSLHWVSESVCQQQVANVYPTYPSVEVVRGHFDILNR